MKKTYENIGEPTLTITKKVARDIPGKELYFRGEIACDVSYAGKTLKTKASLLDIN